jgi:lysozyme family protein
MNFERSQKIVAIAEGGANFDVVNGKPILKPASRNDRGGPTKYGITWGALSAAYSQGIVDHNDIIKLTKDEANEIYRRNYWTPSRADRMGWGLCLIHYDCAVNCGVGSAGKQLQRVLNNLGHNLTVDGVVGPLSLAAVASVQPDSLITEYLNVRAKFYHGLVAKDTRQGAFLKGWLNRLNTIEKEVGIIVK